MLNQCSFIGNLGRDPDVRSFSNGGRVCNLRLAVSERWTDKKTGERKEKTEWIPIAIFNDGLVGIAEKHLRKGSKIFIQGAFETRKYQDQSGNDRYATEVVLRGFGSTLVMLDGKSEQTGDYQTDQRGGGGEPARGAFDDDLDDSVPFLSCDPALEARVS